MAECPAPSQKIRTKIKTRYFLLSLIIFISSLQVSSTYPNQDQQFQTDWNDESATTTESPGVSQTSSDNNFQVTTVHDISDANSEEEKHCGTIFSKTNAKGMAFLLADQDQSSYLAEDDRASEKGWNDTGSVTVENGCEMKLCEETYLDGKCRTLSHGSYSVDEADSGFLRNVVSAKCTCPKQCDCSKIHIKKSTCGRAYLEGGCRTCHASYTDLIVGCRPIFPEEFKSKVESIVLRKGCTLTIYSEEENVGESQVITEEVKEISGDIGSYTCECDDSKYVPKTRPPRKNTFPPLINIPDSMDDVVKMLSEGEHKNHPGLIAARKSYQNGRSHKNAYILLIGSTGSGKSSVINLLFDNPNITKVGDATSTTTDIHEFRIPVPIDELGIANSELRVIDTPGLGDTRGLEQDAKYLATLENYFSTHEELKERIPNVVLILHKFNDNRFDGEGASFVKMIRGLDMFSKKFADYKYSNVIFVFSHFCSERKAVQRRPEERLNRFKRVIQDYSLYPRPTHLVVAENKAAEQELKMVKGFFELPNHEYFPKNLFEKLELVTQKGGDTVGLGVFRTAFRDSEDFNVSSSSYKLMSSSGKKVQKYLNVLANANIGVVKTEVSQHLQQVWDNKVPLSLQKKFPMSLAYLQKSLNLRNINTMPDVPKTTPEVVTLLSALKNDDATRVLLDKGLDIRSPEFPVDTVAGYSYDVFRDMPLPTSPFKLGDGQLSDIGFMVPSSLSCQLDPDTKDHFFTFPTKEDYLRHRLRSLGISGSIPVEEFTEDVKPGFNIKEKSFRRNSCSLSATKDFRLFKFVLNDNLEFSPEFERIVRSLPHFNESNHDTVDTWRKFFNTYGTHVVKSVYGGGSIEIELESNQPFNDKFAEAIFSTVKFAEDMTYELDGSSTGSSSSPSKMILAGEGTTRKTKFNGGSQEYHTNDLWKMPVTESSKLLKNWKNSLKSNPTVLTTEMELLPISHIVKKLGQGYSDKIVKASELLFNSKLKYIPSIKKAKIKGPGDSRDETPLVTELIKMIQQSNERLHELSLELKRMEEKMEERRIAFEKAKLDWAKQQKELEEKYATQRAKSDKEAEEMRIAFELEMAEARRKHELELAKINKDRADAEAKARAEADKRQLEMMRELNNRPTQKSGCLRAGTRILMGDGSERPVEALKIGDVILDKDLQTATVTGILRDYVLGQRFYGFDNASFFFTANHLFVGASSSSYQKDELYAISKSMLYLNNPLMSYLNVTDFDETGAPKLFHLFKSSSNETEVILKNISGVFQDPEEYPDSAFMYDIQVDSPTGTYFANGYVCRHEIPSVEHWPNTISLLFRLMNTPAFGNALKLQYTYKNALLFRQIADLISANVTEFLQERVTLLKSGSMTENENALLTLRDLNVEENMSKLFSHPIVSAVGIRLYSRVGPVVAPYLDNTNSENILTEEEKATLQNELYDYLSSQLSAYIQKLPEDEE